MPPPLDTFVFSPSAITRQAMTATQMSQYYNAIGTGARWGRPIYKFTLEFEALTRSEMDSLTAFHSTHQGHVPFIYDGGEFGNLEFYGLFGEGTGTNTLFYLPHRMVSSWSVRSYRPATGAFSIRASGFTINSATGQVSFTTGIASGDDVQAKYTTKYRVNFPANGFAFEQIAARGGGLFRAELVLTENALDDNV